MSFNERAGLDTSQIVSGKGGAVIGGGLGGIVLMLVMVFLGGNPLGVAGSLVLNEVITQTAGGSQSVDVSDC